MKPAPQLGQPHLSRCRLKLEVGDRVAYLDHASHRGALLRAPFKAEHVGTGTYRGHGP